MIKPAEQDNILTVTPNQNNDSHWVESIGTGNVCGFATFVLGFNTAIIDPESLGTTVDPEFLELYKEELKKAGITNAKSLRDAEIARGDNPLAIQKLCANALKQAFVRILQIDKSALNPFYTMLEINFGIFWSAQHKEPCDLSEQKEFFQELFDKKDEFIEACIRHLDATCNNPFVTFNDIEESLKNPDAIYKKFIDSRNDTDSESNRLIEDIKKEYLNYISNPDNNYMARDIDIAYMARMLGLGKLTIHYQGYNAEYLLDPNSILEIHIRNSGLHWQGTKLPRPTLKNNTNPLLIENTKSFFSSTAKIIGNAVWSTASYLLGAIGFVLSLPIMAINAIFSTSKTDAKVAPKTCDPTIDLSCLNKTVTQEKDTTKETTLTMFKEHCIKQTELKKAVVNSINQRPAKIKNSI